MVSEPELPAVDPTTMVVPALKVPPLVRFTMPMPPEPMVAPLLVTRELVPSTLTIPVGPLLDPAIRAPVRVTWPALKTFRVPVPAMLPR
jgi:hypothetical protein